MAEDEEMSQRLQFMLNELESNRLEVALAPLDPRKRNFNEGGCKRVCLSVNPKWYQRYCAQFASSRGVRRGKFDTRIRRRNTLRALNGLLAGTYRGKYKDELLAAAKKVALSANPF